MAEKPILFNTEMVKAILDDRKTQTRRLIKAPVLYEVSELPDRIDRVTLPWADYQFTWHGKTIGGFELKAPYHPGDVLWVRETWCRIGNPKAGRPMHYCYRADMSDPFKDDMGFIACWRPSIHMPRDAARLFLRAKDARIERLQDMTEKDAICEGYDGMPWCYHHVFENYPDSPIPCHASSGRDCPLDRPCDKSIPELFGETIWNPTIKKSDLPRYGWEANPWVWVIEFERMEV